MEQSAVSALLLVDVVFRYATVALLLLCALLLIRDARHLLAGRVATGVAITVAALLLATPYPGFELPGVLHVFLRVLDTASVGFIWWLGMALFIDGFKLKPWHWMGMLLVVIPSLSFRLVELQLVNFDLLPLLIGSAAFSTVLMGHIMWLALHGRSDDMVESRRRMRLIFVIALTLVTLAIVLIERFVPNSYHIELSLFRVLITFPMALWTLLWLTRLQPESLVFLPVPVALESPPPRVSREDEDLHAKLIQEIEVNKGFREPGLTIKGLADKLSVPEHRLRALINKGMGYRNFSSFLNDYRIAAVQDAMRVANNAGLPILTLALNEGFNSLAPFNKAFRDRTGQTPTEFREALQSPD